MKVLLYDGGIRIVKRSGIARSYEHQRRALKLNRISYASYAMKGTDIVQINTIFPRSLLVALYGRLRGRKIVYYGHSTMEDFRNSFKGSNFFAPFFKKWIKLCYSQGDVIITPTEYSRDLLLSYGIKKPIVALSNGVDTEYYDRERGNRALFRKKYGFSDTDKVVVSVGHYIERKGILDFVEMAKNMPDVQFIWFGYTNLNIVPKSVQKAIETKLPNLHFPGYVTEEEIRDAYAGSDAFLFLTYEETEGMVLLEAMSMRLPVLVRDISIYKEWLPEGVAVWKARDEKEFERVLREMLNGEKDDLTEAAYEVVEKRDIFTLGRKLKTIYKALLRGDAL